MKGTFAEEDEIMGEFKNVPIERSKKNEVEIFHMYSTMSYQKDRFKKRIINFITIVIVTVLILFISKKLVYDSLMELFSEEDENIYNYQGDYAYSRFNQSLEDDGLEYNEGEKFYLYQNISEIDMNSFSSPQLKNPKNIKLIENLEITLEIEYDKFVHMKIKDGKYQKKK